MNRASSRVVSLPATSATLRDLDIQHAPPALYDPISNRASSNNADIVYMPPEDALSNPEKFIHEVVNCNPSQLARRLTFDKDDEARDQELVVAANLKAWLRAEKELASAATVSEFDEYASSIKSRFSNLRELLPRLNSRVNAQEEYDRAFPHRHKTLFTSGETLLCGFEAVIQSIKARPSSLRPPTVESLKAILDSDAWQEHAAPFGMENRDCFSVDRRHSTSVGIAVRPQSSPRLHSRWTCTATSAFQ